MRRLREQVTTAESSMGKREDKEEIEEKAREETLLAQYEQEKLVVSKQLK